MNIPQTHPRFLSLTIRNRIEEGVKKGMTSYNGLIAHGRGEAFDYLIGESTCDFAKLAIKEAVKVLHKAKHPVLSVNGNTAALVPDELISLANLIPAELEINLFHSTPTRLKKIYDHLTKHGARHILLPQKQFTIPHLASDRKFVHSEGIWKADVVFVPLEDGDRTEALISNGKKVITVDLNPLSRTAQKATITIVDNIVRVMPLLISFFKNKAYQIKHNSRYSNTYVLDLAIQRLRSGGKSRSR